MIKDGLKIKTFYKGKEVKIIQLHHLNFFFSGLYTLSSKWKIEPFKKLWNDCEDDLKYHAMTIFIGLLYKDMCTNRGWEVNYKRFKNEMLLKNKNPKVFLLESDYLTIPDNKFDNAFRLLKSVGLVKQGSHHSYIQLVHKGCNNNRKLGIIFLILNTLKDQLEKTHIILEIILVMNIIKLLNNEKKLVLGV